MKSTVEEIRERFDKDVERFSNLETGQTATMDSALVLDLIARIVPGVSPGAKSILDVGCGAGNFTLRILSVLPGLDCMLVDLSKPMLERADARVRAATTGEVVTRQGDIRELDFKDDEFDIIVAAAVLHHLREDAEWETVFSRLHRSLKQGGSIWISDLISHDVPAVQQVLWGRYGDYLAAFQGEVYRDRVYAYVEREDSPRSLLYQCDLLRRVGFREVEILHKNAVFAAFCAIK